MVIIRNPLSSLVLLSAFGVASAEELALPKLGVPSKASDVIGAVAEHADSEAAGKDELEGFWPTPKLRDLMLQRWAEEVSEQYGLDEDKRSTVRKATVDRWSRFLEDNRRSIQPLVNEFIEMRMDLKPPNKEQVQEWADRAMPMLDKFREQLKQGQDEFREQLPFLQKAKFELEALQFAAGMQFAENRLKQWQKGEFADEDLWQPPSGERRKRRAERMARRAEEEAKSDAATADAKANAEQAKEPQDQIAQEMKRWDEYVVEFARTYELDDGQRDTVQSFLSELKDRALAHRDRRREDIGRLEERIKSPSKSDSELKELKAQLAELYGPVDDMFKELCTRLDQVPTTAQRDAAAKRTKDPKTG